MECLASFYNPGKNIWKKIKKSSKTGQDKKSLISTFFSFFFNMNIVLTNKYNKKLQSPGALNIKETPGYKQKDNLKNNK